MSDKPKTTKKKDYAAGHKRAAIRKTASDTLFKKLRSVPQVEIGKLDDMLTKLRKELPQAYELTGTEAGTGTVTAPKNMTTQQAFDYDEAIRRRMDPAKAEKSDEMMARIKTQAQEGHRKKLGKPRPTFFPQEEDEGSPKLKGFFKKIGMESEPVSGDELTRTEESQNTLNQFETNVDMFMKTGNYDTREDAKKDVLALTTIGNFGTTQTPTKKDPIETAGDTYAPHAPDVVSEQGLRIREEALDHQLAEDTLGVDDISDIIDQHQKDTMYSDVHEDDISDAALDDLTRDYDNKYEMWSGDGPEGEGQVVFFTNDDDETTGYWLREGRKPQNVTGMLFPPGDDGL